MKKVEKKVKKVGGGGEWNKLTRPIGVPSPSSRVERGTTELRKEVADALPSGIVKNADGKEVYEASYDGYWRWCSDAGSVQMVEGLREYSEIENLMKKMRPASDSAFALGHALHEMRERLFERISNFLSRKAGQERMKKPVPEIWNDLWQARNSSEPSAPRTPLAQAAKTATARQGRSRGDKGSAGSRKRGQAGGTGATATRGTK